MRAADLAEVARAVDRRLQERFDAEAMAPAPPADDAEFFRRLNVDLIGRIPTAYEARRFIADETADKREQAIDRLLASDEHAEHFANVWRALLIPEADTDRQIRYFLPGFEAWLRNRRAENAGFDVIVRDLLSVPITGTQERPQLVLTDLRAANPMAFIAAKEADPAKLAAAATRLFLGLRLECAECHNHPFDHWTQDQFWNQAAFFAGIEKRGRGPFAPVLEKAETRSIATMSDASRTVPAMFLDGHEPAWQQDRPRTELARWMTSQGNPYFARATVNRVWAQLMGRGFVDPVDDFQESNPPTHPELLDELAAEFCASAFDLTHLYRTLCRTQAYQRTSRQTDSLQADPTLFARMTVKPMSGEQFYDSLAQAVQLEQPPKSRTMTRNEDPVRRRFLDAFGSQGDQSDPDTSVLQALTLMNGPLIGSATDPASSRLLKSAADSGETAPQQIESLYLATLSRYPTQAERQRIVEFLQPGATAESTRQMGDVVWLLLNSAEFRWNH
ncbi:MAG: DUF1553 domain-containing protein [Planctomycetaceae bacterium]|nr:DUF1553 domain-containing protein [Planctomycetaceae bacterium]